MQNGVMLRKQILKKSILGGSNSFLNISHQKYTNTTPTDAIWPSLHCIPSSAVFLNWEILICRTKMTKEKCTRHQFDDLTKYDHKAKKRRMPGKWFLKNMFILGLFKEFSYLTLSKIDLNTGQQYVLPYPKL